MALKIWARCVKMKMAILTAWRIKALTSVLTGRVWVDDPRQAPTPPWARSLKRWAWHRVTSHWLALMTCLLRAATDTNREISIARRRSLCNTSSPMWWSLEDLNRLDSTSSTKCTPIKAWLPMVRLKLVSRMTLEPNRAKARSKWARRRKWRESSHQWSARASSWKKAMKVRTAPTTSGAGTPLGKTYSTRTHNWKKTCKRRLKSLNSTWRWPYCSRKPGKEKKQRLKKQKLLMKKEADQREVALTSHPLDQTSRLTLRLKPREVTIIKRMTLSQKSRANTFKESGPAHISDRLNRARWKRKTHEWNQQKVQKVEERVELPVEKVGKAWNIVPVRWTHLWTKEVPSGQERSNWRLHRFQS